jgi:hypothetical protein
MVEHRNARFAADPLIIAQAPHDTHIALCSHAADNCHRSGEDVLTCVGGFCGCHQLFGSERDYLDGQSLHLMSVIVWCGCISLPRPLSSMGLKSRFELSPVNRSS